MWVLGYLVNVRGTKDEEIKTRNYAYLFDFNYPSDN